MGDRNAPTTVTGVLHRVKRGLAGYVSYLAACDMNQSFSEYLLYEPTLRILHACGYNVQCEFPCVGLGKKRRGDWKRLDFLVEGRGDRFAVETKWIKKRGSDIKSDLLKLKWFRDSEAGGRAFLCVFGRKSFLEGFKPKDDRLKESGPAIYADFGKTRYGCRVFECNRE